MTNKFIKWLIKSRDVMASLLFPPRCPICDEILESEEKGIHLACENRLYPVGGTVCMHCGRPFGNGNQGKLTNLYDSGREYCYDCIEKGYDVRSNIWQGKALYLYKGSIKTSMYRFKYSNKQEYAAFFAREAVRKYGKWMQKNQIDVIVPVPMYLAKQRKRGYNQAETFARELSRLTDIPINTNLVRRVIDTAPQKGLNAQQRRNNLKKAFQKGKFVVQYTCAMVVDDIYTTGGTAEAVARELIKQGTHRVYLLTVCIGEDM